MYCIHCGNKLEESAKFCTRCGAQADRSATNNASKTLSNNETSDTDSVDAESVSEVSSEATDTQTASEAESSLQNDSESSTLKAAIASSRRRSLRRMPVIIIVALALALLSSIAYAAYYVYTEIYLPQQEAQQKEQQEEGQEEENQSAELEPTYSSEAITVTVNISEEAEDFYTGSIEWTYVQFSSSVDNEALDALNAQIKEDFEQTVTNAENWSLDAEDYVELTISQDSVVTYLNGNIASVRTSAYETNLGPHGWESYKNAIYDLEEGKQITPIEYFDIDEETLYEWTRSALITWIANNQDEIDLDISTASGQEYFEDNLAVYIKNMNSQYYLTEDGLVVCTNDYDLGSYASGRREIIVKAFDNESLEGTAETTYLHYAELS